MIKHLSPKTEKELAAITEIEKKELIKFLQKKLPNYKRLPKHVVIFIWPSTNFKIFETFIEQCDKQTYFDYIHKYFPLRNPLMGVWFYKMKFQKQKKRKNWRCISVELIKNDFQITVEQIL